MPRGKRILTAVMWGSAGVLVVAALVCVVVSNFFFPAADQAVLPDQPTGTFFHPSDPPAIRTWKVSFTVGGAAVAVLLLSALLHGLFYPPPEPENDGAKSP